ncbi:MAG: plastocyanin/azurin family copper-binding protein [Thermoleophilaceae bacterium]
MRRHLALTMAVLALGLVAAGCGDDDDDEDGGAAATTEQPAPADTGADETDEDTDAAGGGEELTLTADEGELAWEPAELTAPAGSVTITLDNPAEIPHNVTIEDTDAASETVMADTTSLTTELEAGEYTYFCSVAGHREAGMEGTLTVE